VTNQLHQSSRQTPSATEELVAPLRPILPQSPKAKIMWGVLLVLTIWALAIASFGVPALVWPMKVIVPMAVLTLVAITWGM
jgi:hypothetical protein